MPTEETAPAAEGGAPEPVVADAAAPAAAAEWDGSDWSKLDSYDWWKAVPEGARSHITKAYEERTSAKERTEFLDRLLNADSDKLRTEHAQVVAERDTLKQERDSLKEALSGIEARSMQEAEDREYDRLSKKFEDIFADHFPDPNNPEELLPKGAYVRFVKLLQNGFDEDDAAAMARAVMVNKPGAAPAADASAATQPAVAPAPAALPKTRDVKPPPSIAHAGKGGNNPNATVNMKEATENLEQRAQRLIKEAEQAEKRAARD